MFSEGFVRDFFGMRSKEHSESYKYVTVQEHPSVTDNQHPANPSELFGFWSRSGWEVVSVMTLPPQSNIYMCKAVGVLRKRS